jgi:hypothetical protein
MARGIEGTDVFVQADIENILRGQLLAAATQFQHAGSDTATARAFFDGYCASLFAVASALGLNPRSLEAHVQTQPAQHVFERPRNWRRE